MKEATGGLKVLRRYIEAAGRTAPGLLSAFLRNMPLYPAQLSHPAYLWLLQGQRTINKKDSVCFWWSIYIMVNGAESKKYLLACSRHQS